jgi:hypothetical protein
MVTGRCGVLAILSPSEFFNPRNVCSGSTWNSRHPGRRDAVLK